MTFMLKRDENLIPFTDLLCLK